MQDWVHTAGYDDRLLSALRYAARGWPVLPVWWPAADGGCACGVADCSKPGKHPLVRRGFHAATMQVDLIRRWWTRWPLANVGVRTGALSGLLVVDVDGSVGARSLRALIREHGPLRAAWVRSGSGGWHAYLRTPTHAGVPSSASRLGPGVDVRANGGSIVAPPSVHATGSRYRWLNPDVEPPESPEWLVKLALPPEPPPVVALAIPVSRQPRERYAEAAIDGECRAVAEARPGTRNQWSVAS